MDQIPVEGVVVACTQARAEPVAVVVHLQDASFAEWAMVAARRLKNLTSLAEGELVEVWGHVLIHVYEPSVIVSLILRLVVSLGYFVWPASSWHDARLRHGGRNHAVIRCSS